MVKAIMTMLFLAVVIMAMVNLGMVIMTMLFLAVVILGMVILVVVGLMMTKVVCSNTSPQRAAPLSRPNQTSTANCTLGERTHKWQVDDSNCEVGDASGERIFAVTTFQGVQTACVCVCVCGDPAGGGESVQSVEAFWRAVNLAVLPGSGQEAQAVHDTTLPGTGATEHHTGTTLAPQSTRKTSTPLKAPATPLSHQCKIFTPHHHFHRTTEGRGCP